MRLDVPVVRQEEDSVDCGPACLSMLFKYYGVDKSVSDLKEDIKVYDKMGTYLPQLGKFLLKNGFEIEIITMNPYLFTKKFSEKSQEELAEYLREKHDKTEKENFKEPIKHFKEFIESGGKLTIKVPTDEDIREEIMEGRPLGALMTSNFLLHHKAVFNFHFNLITGIDDEFIYANDPMWDHRGGSQKYLIHEFMFAIYASAYGDLDNASIMKIKKN